MLAQPLALVEGKARAAAAKSGLELVDEGEQGRLNRVVAELIDC